MRCHTWPPAASDPHKGVRATMNEPPSPAPGWHILIHERAWALSGQNYRYQNATINTFINTTLISGHFSLPLPKKKKKSPNFQKIQVLVLYCFCFSTVAVSVESFKHICRQWCPWTPCALTNDRPQLWSDTPVCQWSGSSLLLLMALWAVNSVSPRCWWACPMTCWPKQP